MTNTSEEQCPVASTWHRFLDSAAIPRHDELRHLADCPVCQAELESSAADPATWSLAEQSLRDTGEACHVTPGCDAHQHAHSSSYSSRSNSLEVEWTEPALRALLPPPRQPDFLARLGRYDVERLIGQGGMGLVFRAHDSRLNRVVAVKILAPHLSRMGAARQRFTREARAVAAVVHPHIVSIHDVVPESDPPFLVMQLVDGPSLQQVVDATGPLPIEQILRLAIQLAEALTAAHDQGLIHRDIKPGNILLEADGQRALLTDFGLVRTLDDASLTHSGVLAGTPHYMSPEQARGEPVDHRSDLFALGSVLYHLCTGRPPFRAPQPLAVLHRVCHQRHRPIREIRREVPMKLSAIIDCLLSKQPSQRFASADSLRTELLRLQRGDQEKSVGHAWIAALRERSPSRWLIGCGAVIALLVCASNYSHFIRSMIGSRTNSPATSGRASGEFSRLHEQTHSVDSESIHVASVRGIFSDLDSLEHRIDDVRNNLNYLEQEIRNEARNERSGAADSWDLGSANLKHAIQEFGATNPF